MTVSGASSSSATAAAVAVVAVTAAVGYLCHRAWVEQDHHLRCVDTGEVVTELLDLESTSLMLMVPSISTVTFYHGRASNVREYLETRIREIVLANPWLQGRLVQRRRDQRLFLIHRADGSIRQQTFSFVEDHSLTSSMSYEEWTPHFKPLVVQAGNALVQNHRTCAIENRTADCAPLFRVTLIDMGASSSTNDTTASENHEFAVCFSLSHIVADGHTFYRLYAMLNDGSTHSPVCPLNITRTLTFSKQMNEAMGGNDTYDWCFSAAMMVNIVKTLLWDIKPTVLLQDMSSRWIQQQKADFSSWAQGSAMTLPAFVSSNDILTSWCFRSLDCDVGLFAMNLRHRLAHLSADDDNLAGNYEALVAVQPRDYAFPHLIRQSLPLLHRVFRAQQPLPGPLASLTARVAVLSNWTTFYHDISLPHAKHTLHTPFFDTDEQVAFRDICVLFCPREGETRLFVMTRSAHHCDSLPQQKSLYR